MRRQRFFLPLFILGFLCPFQASAQKAIVDKINEYGTFDRWSARAVKESGIIGGQTRLLYEFFGDGDTTATREPYSAPEGYYWRTNNVMAVVSGVTKTNNTVFPEQRGDGYCARIETHIETVKALGIINMDVTCQGAIIIGSINEPIKDTKNPMSKVLYGIPFHERPEALIFDYKAEVGHMTVRGTGFSKLKVLEIPDYPIIAIILQKRWEDEDGNVHALRVGTGLELVTENIDEWENGHILPIHYGDITGKPFYTEYMRLLTEPDRAYHTINSKGDNVTVMEEGWAAEDEEPNCLVIKFLSSSGLPFYGGVGNTLWIDNVILKL